MSLIDIGKPRITPVSSLYKIHTTVDVLRLDEIHPVISGNKWFKLKEYLDEVRSQQKKIILTFGGAWSNHIVATAAATSLAGFKSIGVIRGEEAENLSITLKNAVELGMELVFVSREEYRKKIIPQSVLNIFSPSQIFVIPEGGYGLPGAKGAAHILDSVDVQRYDYILAAAGTGTMLAGLIISGGNSIRIVGIPVLKHKGLRADIIHLIKENKNEFSLIEGYEFGGYAKKDNRLISFMNSWYEQTGIPSDFVYTGKLFYAYDDLVRRGYFPASSKILLIHSGGLQGNSSLPKGTLIF
jgi:1-aminocyclopropane-1-carboxylate deaminase